jgi:cobalt-zinc-cadmium efflux system outer membrane protein
MLALSSWAAGAEDFNLRQVLGRALDGNPLLVAEASALEAARTQAQADGLSPAWHVSADLEQFGGTGSLSGFASAETTLRIGRIFELGGKREARMVLADARVAGQQNEMERRRLDVTAVAAQRFFEVLAWQARVELVESELDLARETRDTVTRRVQRGVAPEADLPLAELAVAQVALELEDSRHELASARVNLSVLWGERAPSFDRVTGSLEPAPPLPELPFLAARASSGVDQRHFELQADILDAQARAAKAAHKPDVLGAIGVRRLEAADDQALVMSVTVPFGLAKRSDLASSRIRAERAGLEARRGAAELDLYRALHARDQELRHALHEYETVRDEMVPSAERALELARKGYDQARYSFLHVADAQRVLHTLQHRQIDASLRYQRLLAEIQRMTAVPGEPTP